MYNDPLLFLDLETTGLDGRAPNFCILEVAATFAYHDAGELHCNQGRSWVIAPTIPLGLLDPYVYDMHRQNGLLAACQDPSLAVPLAEAETLIVADLPKNQKVTIAGDSAHVDLEWIRIHMPRLAACLSHRVANTTALAKVMAQAQADLPKNTSHRAANDVDFSIDRYKRALRLMTLGARSAAMQESETFAARYQAAVNGGAA